MSQPATQTMIRSNVRVGSFSDLGARSCEVRFTIDERTSRACSMLCKVTRPASGSACPTSSKQWLRLRASGHCEEERQRAKLSMIQLRPGRDTTQCLGTADVQ